MAAKGKVCSEETKQKMRLAKQRNPVWNKGKKLSLEYKEKIKLNHWSKSNNKEEICKKISTFAKGRKITDETRRKLQFASTGNNNPMFGKKHTNQIKELISKKATDRFSDINYKQNWKKTHWCLTSGATLIANKISITNGLLIATGKKNTPTNHGFKHGYYYSTKMNDNFYYRSSYELLRYKMLDVDNNVKTFTPKHGICLSYYINNLIKSYVPDLLIEMNDGTQFLEEIKGWVDNMETFEAKCAAAKIYCNTNNITFRVIFREDLNI